MSEGNEMQTEGRQIWKNKLKSYYETRKYIKRVDTDVSVYIESRSISNLMCINLI